MEIVIGDLLTQTDVPNIAHGANCFCMMGAGIAGAISIKYPEVYAADCATIRGDFSKLGSYSKAETKDGKVIYNVYSQYYGGKNLEYGSLYNGLLNVAYTINEAGFRKLGVPYFMGCGIAGGNWVIVEKIIKTVEMIIDEHNKCDFTNQHDPFVIVCYDIDGLSKLEKKI